MTLGYFGCVPSEIFPLRRDRFPDNERTRSTVELCDHWCSATWLREKLCTYCSPGRHLITILDLWCLKKFMHCLRNSLHGASEHPLKAEQLGTWILSRGSAMRFNPGVVSPTWFVLVIYWSFGHCNTRNPQTTSGGLFLSIGMYDRMCWTPLS